MLFCSLTKGITPNICRCYLVLIINILQAVEECIHLLTVVVVVVLFVFCFFGGVGGGVGWGW